MQDAVESALSAIAGAPVSVTCAGRTDSGVHAIEQVVHFDTDADRPATAWVRGVNSSLPESVAVLWSQPVEAAFHARYSAVSRTYRYRLINRAVRPALAARHAGWVHASLKIENMREAAALLLGEHDFSAFRSAQCQAKSPVRKIYEIQVDERPEGRIDFVVRANAFLHHMVRNIVGTLIYVGKGSFSPLYVRDVLLSKDRSKAAPTFGPEGLYLEKVRYEEKWGLPQ